MARAIPRDFAFAIFVGTTHLSAQLLGTFSTGLHAAFLTSIVFMVIVAVLSATPLLKRRVECPMFGQRRHPRIDECDIAHRVLVAAPPTTKSLGPTNSTIVHGDD